MAEFSEANPTKADRPCPRRRWLQFGFSTLLKLVAVAAVLSAGWADRERLTDRIGRLENDQSVLRGPHHRAAAELAPVAGTLRVSSVQSSRSARRE